MAMVVTMTQREQRWGFYSIGWGLIGLGLIVAGYPQWAWMPFSVFGYWIGYRCAFARIESGAFGELPTSKEG